MLRAVGGTLHTYNKIYQELGILSVPITRYTTELGVLAVPITRYTTELGVFSVPITRYTGQFHGVGRTFRTL